MTNGYYDKKFYETNYPDSKTSAQIVLNHILSLIPGVESVADVGCGSGVWLSVLKERGVKTIQGYDRISARDAFKLFSIRLRKAIQHRVPVRKA